MMLTDRHDDERWREAMPAAPSAAASTVLPEWTWYLPVKRVFDFLAALILLVGTLPLVALFALLVRLTSPGPALYSQTRLGRKGRPYTIYKLRTMTHNCERHTGPRWASSQDAHITPLGRFLRASHLDELPQLWNVVRGDMSLVGPRPERPEFVRTLEKAVPLYSERLNVLPGVTGLAQVQLPADRDLHGVKLKVAYDLYYIRHAGPLLDLKLIACTALKVIGLGFRWTGRLLFIPTGAVVEWPYFRRPVGPQASTRLDIPEQPTEEIPIIAPELPPG